MPGGSERRNGAVLNVGAVTMQLAIVIGGSGAVTSFKGFGATGVAKNGTGTYDITLNRKWGRVQCIHGSVQRAGAAAVLVPRTKATYTPSTTLQFETVVTAGTATDPASGDIIFLDVTFDDSNGIL